VLCEGFYFKVYLAPKEEPRHAARGAMLDRFLECLQEVHDALPNPPAQNASLQDVRRWCCDVRDNLLDLFARHPGTQCGLLDEISRLCPDPPPGTTPSQYLNSVSAELSHITTQFYLHCFCSSLLPSCPAAVIDPCVPLATVTVRKKDCKIVRICNLENRKFLVTFPNLAYWLSWSPLVRDLRKRLEKACCEVPEKPQVHVRPGFSHVTADTFARARNTSRRSANFSGAVADAFVRESPFSVFHALALDSLGLHDNAGTPFVSEAEAADPFDAIIARQFLAPLVRDNVPAGITALLSAAGGLDAARLVDENKRRDKAAEAMREEIAALRDIVRKQQVTIDGLIKRVQ
jgi:hypothetical protein